MFEKRMRNTYETQKDLYDRLNGTIILYDEAPCTVSIMGDEIHLFKLEEYPNHKPFKVSKDDPLLDISSIELGYANWNPADSGLNNLKRHAIYYQRHPERQYRQGLCTGRTQTRSPLQGKDLPYNPGLESVSFVNMVKNIYPSVHEAVWDLNSGVADSVAISREIALVNEPSGIITVAFKRDNIGVMIPNQNKILVRDHEFVWVLDRIFTRFNVSLEKF